MFSVTNFIKFIIALTLTSGTTALRIIGDIGKLVGSGTSGSVAGFLVVLIFYWFVVSKAFEFLAFTFGGGVGRYNTTKLYRRLQWLTFALFMSVPVWIGVTLLFSLTPLAEHSERYHRQVERIEAQRERAALEQQRSQVESAKIERQVAISVEENRQKKAYDQAVSKRSDRIKNKRSELRQAVEDQINATNEGQILAKLEADLQARLEPIVQKYTSEDYDNDKFQKEFNDYLSAVARRFDVSFSSKQR